MVENNIKPKVLWIIQENQLSAIIINFLSLLKKTLQNIDIQILIPELYPETNKMAKPLGPKKFKATKEKPHTSYHNFCMKRDLIKDLEFPGGLKVWRTLLLDDFHEGFISETKLQIPNISNVGAVVLQIPTPLGSSREEEHIFYAWIALAKKAALPIAGYELLPLDTRWTMLPSLLDGVITTNKRSYEYLTMEGHRIPGKVWQLPRYEGKVFSTGTSHIWDDGLNSAYYNRHVNDIPEEITIFYIPHNVTMNHEYKRLLEELSENGDNIHLMFAIGKDQIRGTHTHKDIIETTCFKTLPSFYSYSFHDFNTPWEMIIADAIVACCSCYSTLIAKEIGIPCIVKDAYVSPTASRALTTVNTDIEFRDYIKKTIIAHKSITGMSTVLQNMISGKIKKITP
ncbi:MAG: hypothetical protein ABIJ59_17515 [Pseudomonadota bacterium]